MASLRLVFNPSPPPVPQLAPPPPPLGPFLALHSPSIALSPPCKPSLSLPSCLHTGNRWNRCSLALARASGGTNRENPGKWGAVEDAIFELEYMVREPAEVLGGMQERLSTRDLQLMLLYFSQDGRDSWCALEVFEWMQSVNKVEDETRELMMSIMCRWLMKLVEQGHPVEEVGGLLRDMSCVGLKPESYVVQAIISTYWDKGKKEEALKFVKDITNTLEIAGEGAQEAVAFLIITMANSKEQRKAMKLIAHFRDCCLKLPGHAYNAALLAAVSEQEQLTRMMRLLAAYQVNGHVGELEESGKEAIQAYETHLHEEAEQIAKWAMEEEVCESTAPIHEKLLAMYCIAGKGLEAEHQLWQMKIAGREVTMDTYNTIVGICAYRKLGDAARRIMKTMKAFGRKPNKKTYSIMIGGFLKGGHAEEAGNAFEEMLDKGFSPDKQEMMVVLRQLQKAGNVTLYVKLCQKLAQAGLIEPFLIYLYVDYLKLCIIIML